MATFEIKFERDPKLLLGQSLADFLFLDKILEQEMLNTRARIIADTQSGVDAEGIALKPYSQSYIKAIDSGRVFGKSPGDRTVNLTATGQLMRSMQIEANGLEIRMFFQGTHSASRRVGKKSAAKKRKAAIAAGHQLSSHKGGGSGGSKGASLGKRSGGGGGGGSLGNAQLAKYQYELGRPYWFAFSGLDIDRIIGRVSAELLKIGSVLF